MLLLLLLLLLVVVVVVWVAVVLLSTLASEARSAGCREMRSPSILSKKPKVRPAGIAWMFPLPLRVGTSLRVAVPSKLPRLCVWSVECGGGSGWMGKESLNSGRKRQKMRIHSAYGLFCGMSFKSVLRARS